MLIAGGLLTWFYPHVCTAQNRPNIIVFLIDDMGWQDTSVPFWKEKTPLNSRYHTPNMERLAKEGMKFTNAYAAPVCTPSRTSMLSGMNASHSRITNWTSPEKDKRTDAADTQLETPDWNYNGLSPVPNIAHTQYATVFPQLLKEAGYTTIHVGKAHWGSAGTPGANPYNMGFEVNIAGHAAGHPQSYLASDFYGNKPGKAQWQAVPDLEEYYDTETFLTEALTQESIKAMRNAIDKKQPFYLNFAHYAVHLPFMADKRFYQKYIEAGLPEPEARYASMIEGMDKSLGDVMDFLKAKGIEKNTVIIFMSDNGGLSQSQRAGAPHTQNLPLKAGKGSVYEGGIREPMIVKWPAVVKPSATANQYVIIEDYFPTILEMAGIKGYKTIQQVDGKSFMPVLKDHNYRDDTRFLYWNMPNKWLPVDGPGINFKSAIRQGDWKLVYNMRDSSMELYNLSNDIGETKDLAHQYPEKAKALASQLSQQFRKWNAQMPFDKVKNEKVKLPDEL